MASIIRPMNEPSTSAERTSANAPGGKDRRFLLGLLTVVIVQIGLIAYFEPLDLIFDEAPNNWIDYDTHIEQTWRVTEALDGWGKSWAYDPYLLAGYPNGTIFDADNKGWELWTFALWKLGVPRGTAFNLFILLAHVLLPWVIFAAARLFGLDKNQALVAASMAMTLWFFDAFSRWTWWVGMTAYGFAAYLFMLPLALLYAYLKHKKWRHVISLAVVMSLGHLVHPYMFVVLVFPMLALYGRAFRGLGVKHQLALWGVVLTVIATNIYWLAVSVRFWHYILNSAFYCQSTLVYLWSDYFGLLKEPLVTGVLLSVTSFRFIYLAAAIAMLVVWRKNRDDRFMPFTVGIASMLALAYLGGYNLAFSQIQPYRHVMPAMYLTLIPAAVLATDLVRKQVFKGLPRLSYALFAVVLLVAGGAMARDILYFVPDALPAPEYTPADAHQLKTLNPDAKVEEVLGRQMPMIHEPAFPDFGDIADWLLEHDKGQGRVLVEWWILGEHLTWRSKSQILGGFLERNLEHAAANIYRRREERTLTKEEVRQYFEDYAVGLVIVTHRYDWLENEFADLLEPVGFIPPIHRFYRPKVDVTFFAENDGVVKASLNKLEVTGTDPDKDVVLRYHWLETFICQEGCTIEKEPMPLDPVGFIRIKAPHPADFTIVNGY